MWDDRVRVHTQSEMYDLDSFKKGRNSLTSIELDDIGDVNGKKILHLQCHFGQDSLSMARMGAEVTGVDFSGKAIDFAKKMNAELGLNVKFIQSDVYELKGNLNQKFDLVFTSFGVIGWLPDLTKWANIINHFLKPDGIFYLAEFHPFIWTLDHENDFRFHYPYFNISVIEESAKGTYADEEADLFHTNYSWNHSIADVLNPLIKHGFKLIQFNEYDYSPFNVFPDMFAFEENKFRIKKFGKNIPYVYSLLFEKIIIDKIPINTEILSLC
jgi:SAM-dependent methyltransferase